MQLTWIPPARDAETDPAALHTLYVQTLAASGTINKLPEKTVLAYADHSKVGRILPPGAGNAEAVISEFRREVIDDEALAVRLQCEGHDAFAASWHALLRIREKCKSSPTTVLNVGRLWNGGTTQ